MSNKINDVLMDIAREQMEELTEEEKQMARQDHLTSDEQDSVKAEREYDYAE